VPLHIGMLYNDGDGVNCPLGQESVAFASERKADSRFARQGGRAWMTNGGWWGNWTAQVVTEAKERLGGSVVGG